MPQFIANEDIYNVSEYAVLVEAFGDLFVISEVNGSLCVNPYEDAVTAEIFDAHLDEWIIVNKPTILGRAVWHADKKRYRQEAI